MMTAAQPLAHATIESARYLGHEKDWGTIEAGKLADFFLVTGDPSEILDAVHGIRMTFAQGHACFPSEIYEAFDIKRFATIPAVRAFEPSRRSMRVVPKSILQIHPNAR